MERAEGARSTRAKLLKREVRLPHLVSQKEEASEASAAFRPSSSGRPEEPFLRGAGGRNAEGRTGAAAGGGDGATMANPAGPALAPFFVCAPSDACHSGLSTASGHLMLLKDPQSELVSRRTCNSYRFMNGIRIALSGRAMHGCLWWPPSTPLSIRQMYRVPPPMRCTAVAPCQSCQRRVRSRCVHARAKDFTHALRVTKKRNETMEEHTERSEKEFGEREGRGRNQGGNEEAGSALRIPLLHSTSFCNARHVMCSQCFLSHL